jgi:diguanylate cyclase (GGDEF)-like protein
MDSTLRTQARIGQRALLLTTLAVPLTGWTVHAVALHRRLATAQRDPLTGVLRRDGFTLRAKHLIGRYGDDVLVLIGDVDHFKQINDSAGHPVGDLVLAVTAARITSWAGSRGVVGRLGGDEFGVAVRIGPGRRRARLEQLLRALREPVTVDDGTDGPFTVDVAVSVGAAAPEAIGSRELSQLMRAADTAMFAGKHSGTAVQAGPEHTTATSINGRRAGRPGTHNRMGRSA